MDTLQRLTDKLAEEKNLEDEEFLYLLNGLKNEMAELSADSVFKLAFESESLANPVEYLLFRAREARQKIYGNSVYMRGLIEFTNYCKNNCLYCGIRAANGKVDRYRLTADDILSCTEQGYELGFRTFVLQGGEDPFFTDQKMCEIVSAIKARHPDCAVTLSIGEKTKESYKAYFDAGADRYLLRHETADEEHYSKLHPAELSLKNRKRCLYDLKEIGYQVGCGMMLGSPYQTDENIIEDIRFMQELKPHMIGIGPFIPHRDTPFGTEKAGSLGETIIMLAVLRLIFTHALLPATTALGTIHPLGRELGILAGANVVMPNLSPKSTREKYMLYDGKVCNGEEAAECHRAMEKKIEAAECRAVISRGDYKV